MILYGIDNIRDLFGHKVTLYILSSSLVVSFHSSELDFTWFSYFVGRSWSHQEKPNMPPWIIAYWKILPPLQNFCSTAFCLFRIQSVRISSLESIQETCLINQMTTARSGLPFVSNSFCGDLMTHW